MHVGPPLIPRIKSKSDGKSEKYSVKLKLHRDPISGTSHFFELKISLFGNGEMEYFLWFVHKFNMTIAASRKLQTGAKDQYLCILVHGESLCQFYLLSADMESTNPLNMEYIIKRDVVLLTPCKFSIRKKARDTPQN